MSAIVEKENVIMGEAMGDAKKPRLEEQPARLSVRFVRLREEAKMPSYGSLHAAGADLHSAEDTVVPPKGKLCVSTGLQLELPEGHYGRVAPRSGLAAKNFIDVGAGVVDSDYRGELKVLLFNFSDEEFKISKGDRIAQLICEKISQVQYEEVENLQETTRGAGGFGSTGVSAAPQ